MYNVKLNKHFISKDKIAKVRELSTATVHEVLGKVGAMSHSILPLSENLKMCGEALTVKNHSGDNLMVIKAISMLEEDQVLVIDGGNILDSGPFGEILAVECMSNKAAGLVTNGSVRDSKQIRDMGFPVFSRGVSIRGTSKKASGLINHDISCADVVVRAGDIVLGDDDGVVVIPHEKVDFVIEESIKRDQSESLIIDRIKAGESLFDIHGYQKTFNDLGIKVEKGENHDI